MRISDWSSDVCSSDLPAFELGHADRRLSTDHYIVHLDKRLRALFAQYARFQHQAIFAYVFASEERGEDLGNFCWRHVDQEPESPLIEADHPPARRRQITRRTQPSDRTRGE